MKNCHITASGVEENKGGKRGREYFQNKTTDWNTWESRRVNFEFFGRVIVYHLTYIIVLESFV